MADVVISESEARLLRMLFGGAIKPKVKPIDPSSSVVVMGGGSADELSRSPDEIRAGIVLVFFPLLHGCYEGFPL